MDQSHLDDRYFIDHESYNCPFCNRRHVSYHIQSVFRFDWSPTKRCWAYIAECHSCSRTSMHLSYEELEVFEWKRVEGRRLWRFNLQAIDDPDGYLDLAFFYSVPTSFFVLDPRVPKVLRELLTEAEGCLKSNFLTGASACARKMIYELAVLEGAQGKKSYEDRVKSLKTLREDVDEVYFDSLLTIQQATSEKVHENAYDGWEARHLRVILATLREVLHLMYVVPKLREEKRQAIIAMREEVTGKRAVAAPIKAVANVEQERPQSQSVEDQENA